MNSCHEYNMFSTAFLLSFFASSSSSLSSLSFCLRRICIYYTCVYATCCCCCRLPLRCRLVATATATDDTDDDDEDNIVVLPHGGSSSGGARAPRVHATRLLHMYTSISRSARRRRAILAGESLEMSGWQKLRWGF